MHLINVCLDNLESILMHLGSSLCVARQLQSMLIGTAPSRPIGDAHALLIGWRLRQHLDGKSLQQSICWPCPCSDSNFCVHQERCLCLATDVSGLELLLKGFE